jgi:hypothetical protein
VDQPVSYQWLDCHAGFAVIPGETNQNFTPSTSGSYAVMLGAADCIDTSSCYEVVVVSIHDPGILADALIYPNPTDDNVFLRLSNSISQVELMLTDLQGRDIWKRQMAISANGAIELPATPGIYLLKLTYDTYTRTFRVVKM